MIKKLCLCIFLWSFPIILFGQSYQRPNIIIILADDLGWGDVGYHGSDIRTPNIDRLAHEGIILNRYYTAPICSPARAGLLTGRYPNRVGIRQATIPPWSYFGLDTSEKLIPQYLAEAGYKNRAIIGKWHLGENYKMYLPLHRGFTHFYGFYNGAIDYFTHKRAGEVDWHNDSLPSDDKGYSTDLITREAVRSIKEYAKEGPFFLYVAYNAPHGPYEAKISDLLLYGYDSTKPKFDKSPTGEDAATGTAHHGNTIRQTYKAMVTCMDRGIGEILQALEERHIDKNTLVFFMSDNGAPHHGGSNRPLRGFKFQEWEGGVRVPAVVRWPAGLKGGRTINQVVGYVDLLPSILAAAHADVSLKKPLDGINILPALKTDPVELHRNFYLGHGAVINNHWKLIKAFSGNPLMRIHQDQLFKIPPDYTEGRNLIKKHQDIYKKLLQAIAPYDAIKAQREILGKGPKGEYVAPKHWIISK